MTGSPYQRRDAVFALDVGNKPTLTFAANNLREARSITHEEWLHDDLRKARSNGTPIWDGQAKLTVRNALPEETEAFKEISISVQDGSGDLVLVYLIELDD